MAKGLPPVRNSGTPTRPARRGAEQAPRAGYRVGRPAGDPDDVRSNRIVQRIHPHLVEAIDEVARDEGLTRSLFIERILIRAMNHEHGARLDAIGRWRPVEDHEDTPRMVRAKPFAVGERVQAEYDAAQREMLQQSIVRRSDKPVQPKLPPRKPNKK